MSVRAALDAIETIPRDEDGPVFSEPWQAQAFAMAVTMNEKGYFTWSEWAETIAEEIASDPSPQAYYDNWLKALENILHNKRIIDARERRERTNAWHRASLATPHGEPIVLGREKQTKLV